MKSFYGFSLSVVLLGVLGAASTGFAKPIEAEKQQVIVRFERAVIMHDVFLRGDYLIVHDSALMEEGKPCFLIYTMNKGRPGKLVTTFHCEPVARPKTAELKIGYYSISFGGGTRKVSEIQFAGDAEGHRLSAKHH